MKASRTLAVAGVGLLVLAIGPTVRADWNTGDPHKMHYPQLPDLTHTGMDVDNMWGVLADDFRCSWTGPITDIHIWASWESDLAPWSKDGTHRDPGNVKFDLSIHQDLPVGHPDNPFNYSIPADPAEWTMTMYPEDQASGAYFTWREYQKDLQEWWYDPATQIWYTPGDTIVYQYNFHIPEAAAFPQEEDTIYWLDVRAWPWDWTVDPYDPTGTFGWKTARPEDHWNDDAVFLQDGVPFWVSLHYPGGDPTHQDHPLYPETLDLAFVITPEPGTLIMLALGGLTLIRRKRR